MGNQVAKKILLLRKLLKEPNQ